MTLHCLNKPVDSSAAARLHTQLQAGEALLLLGPAVRLASEHHPQLPRWLSKSLLLYALEEDLQAYAVHAVHGSVERIDYAAWVTLTEEHATQLLWR